METWLRNGQVLHIGQMQRWLLTWWGFVFLLGLRIGMEVGGRWSWLLKTEGCLGWGWRRSWSHSNPLRMQQPLHEHYKLNHFLSIFSFIPSLHSLILHIMCLMSFSNIHSEIILEIEGLRLSSLVNWAPSQLLYNKWKLTLLAIQHTGVSHHYLHLVYLAPPAFHTFSSLPHW